MKRALLLLVFAVAIAAIGSVITVGGNSSTGAASTPSLPVAPAGTVPLATAPGSAVPATKPGATLHLPGPLHIVEHVTGSSRLSSGKTLVSVSLSRHGHLVGDGVYTCTTGSTSDSCAAGFALSGGLIVADVTIHVSSGAVSGTVDGGTGQYDGATGTIKGKTRANRTVALTITYSTG
ncbi:MAG TPA: hypothetical protein VHC43_12120 [Mycobacteriales bacterium]|nr:hypothetical protein [Mycobacteriales bacterium]